jgi:hypothetical protein
MLPPAVFSKRHDVRAPTRQPVVSIGLERFRQACELCFGELIEVRKERLLCVGKPEEFPPHLFARIAARKLLKLYSVNW